MLFLLLLILSSMNQFSQQSDFSKLTGHYLGQKPPGMTPEILVHGIISTIHHAQRSPTLSPDRKYLFFISNREQDYLKYKKFLL